MNTEKTSTITEIRNLLNEINPKIPTYQVGSNEREKLEQTAAELESLLWNVVHEDLKQTINELIESKEKLQVIANELKNENEELKEIGNKVEKAAKVVGVLVNAIQSTASA